MKIPPKRNTDRRLAMLESAQEQSGLKTHQFLKFTRSILYSVKECDSGDVMPSRQLRSHYQGLTGEVCTNRFVPTNAEEGVLKGLK